jgi:hypothetical protein
MVFPGIRFAGFRAGRSRLGHYGRRARERGVVVVPEKP